LFLFIFLYTFTSTWTYFQQAELTKVGIVDKAARTAFFAKLDLSVNTLTLLLQVFLTGRLMKFLGVTVTLLFMPVLSLFGFAATCRPGSFSSRASGQHVCLHAPRA